MVVGLGTDLVVIARIKHLLERHGERFLTRVFTPREREECLSRPQVPQALAVRFAAKEATMKALGTGYRQGVKFQEIEVYHLPSGQPQLRLSGVAAEHARRLGATRPHVSLTHDGGLGHAVVILEGEPGCPA